MLKSDPESLSIGLVGLVLGTIVAMGLHWLPRYRVPDIAPTRPWDLPWHYHGIQTILVAVFAAMFPGRHQRMLIAAAAMCLMVTVWRFRQQRVQFSLRSMLLAMLLVAMICSARYYVPLAAVLALLAMPAMEWIRLEQGKQSTQAPPQDRGGEADPR